MEEKHLIFLGIAAISLLIIVVIGGGTIALISTPTKTSTPTITATITPTPLIIGVHVDSSDNKTRYEAKKDGSIDIIRKKDNAITWNIPLNITNITDLSLNKDNTVLVISVNDTPSYTLDLTSHVLTQLPTVIRPTIIPETPTPVVTPTVRPTQDMTSEKRFVVIITPTPTIVLDKSIKISATINNPVQIGDNLTIKTYIETHDTPLHNILVRLNLSYYSKEHDWQGLGYIPIESSKVLSLPAHSKTERELGPIRVTTNGIVLPDGSLYNFRVWATVYKIRIDLIDRSDNSIVGSTELNNVQVVKVDQYGQRTFDWLV